jgi:hypothetical protein
MQRPEQIGVFVVAGVKEISVGGHHIGRDDIVEGQAVPPCQVSDATAQRQAGDTSRGDDPTHGVKPEGMGRVIEIPPGTPALCGGEPSRAPQYRAPNLRRHCYRRSG